MANYFNLNNHIYKKKEETVVEVMKAMDTGSVATEETDKSLSIWEQILMYFGVFTGILFSTAVGQFSKGKAVNVDINFTVLIIAAVVAFITVPVVYEKVRLDPKTPILIQFGIFVQNGVFWQVIFDSIGKMV